MPELPEVEINARNLRKWAIGHRIDAVEIDPTAKRILRPATPAAFAKTLRGLSARTVARHGKYILVTLTGSDGAMGLVSHLGMTGKWVFTKDEADTRWSRVRLHLSGGGVLHYVDLRLFGRLRLAPRARFQDIPEVASLGPDPLNDGIDVDRLAEGLARTRRPVKVALLDQELLPGVGNIQASESLFRARIDPRRGANSLSRTEVTRLAKSVLESIRESIRRESGPKLQYVEEPGAPNPFVVYDREGARCPRGRGSIQRIVQAQRSTYFCASCQR